MTKINILISLLTLFTYLIIMCFGAPTVKEEEEVIYDQRQNGSENLRVHINDIIIVHAPVEALVALASLTDASAIQQQLMEIIIGSSSSSTPRPNTTTTTAEAATTSGLSVTSSADESTSSVSTDGTFTTGTSEKPASSESTKPPKKTKGRLRLSSLLMPFLRRL